MKKLLSSVGALALFCAITTSNVLAHSYLAGSSPSDGEEVTAQLETITLNFDGKIMQGSFVEVTSTEGIKADVSALTIGEGSITATFAEPLANGEYKVKWSIISADGHPLEGEYMFTQNAVIDESAQTEEDDSQNKGTVDDNSIIPNANDNDSTMEGSKTLIFVMVGLAALIIVSAAILLAKRKK